jgi:outer membrane lipoprotein carrier protein
MQSNRNRPIRAAASLSISLALSAFPLGADAGGLDQLKGFLSGTRTAQGGFEQVVVGKSGRAPQQASGSMAFARPGKFRWVYDKPYYQLIVGDGEKLWIYDRDLNQVTVKTLGQALGSSPAALLAGDDALERDFVLKDAGRSDGLEWVEATPKARDGSFERVRIGFSGDLPRVMELQDSFGQTTTLKFAGLQRNPALDAGQFRFAPPKGADVVGE